MSQIPPQSQPQRRTFRDHQLVDLFGNVRGHVLEGCLFTAPIYTNVLLTPSERPDQGLLRWYLELV